MFNNFDIFQANNNVHGVDTPSRMETMSFIVETILHTTPQKYVVKESMSDSALIVIALKEF